ncbi:uncharacterized protein [Henckelia pumila]|uniref:uncharacterized protein isoform X2 n=1 Tax=Henckelia pumila TaxID=405737 RepID=UPI003C6E7BBE
MPHRSRVPSVLSGDSDLHSSSVMVAVSPPRISLDCLGHRYYRNNTGTASSSTASTRSPLFSPSSCRSTTPAFHHNQELLAVFQIPSILIFQTLAIPFFSPSVPPIYVSFFVLCRSALLDRNLKKKEVKKRGGGFAKLCKLSPELEKFTGVLELARIEVVKQLWCYIREKNFQDPSNRRNIICDNTLRNLFGVDSIDMFQMNKALTKHIWKIDASGAAVISAPKDKPRKQERNKVGSSCTMRRGVFLNGQVLNN